MSWIALYDSMDHHLYCTLMYSTVLRRRTKLFGPLSNHGRICVFHEDVDVLQSADTL